jgi:hypothetical protein
MSGTLSSTTASALAPFLKDLTSVASLGSTGYNLFNQYQNQQYQNQLRSMAQDPAKMNAYAAKFTQPLTAGLTTGVANQAQADLATRGLTDSPEISQQVYAQAIAPYIQQDQQQGYQNALQALQVGGGAIPPATQQQNSLAALTKAFSQMGGQGGQAPGALQALQNYLRTMGTQAPQLDSSQWAPPGAGVTAPIDPSGLGGGGAPDFSSFGSTPPDVTGPTSDFSYEPDYGALAANYGSGG